MVGRTGIAGTRASCMHAIVVLAMAAVLAGAHADEGWSRWRGVDGAGRGREARFPVEWSEADLAWSTPLPGRGHASPVVRAGRIYTASADEAAGVRIVACHALDDGRLIWSRELAGPLAIGTSGDGGGDTRLVAVRMPDTAGGRDLVEPEIAFTLDRSAAPYVPTPLVVGGRIYLWGDRGVVTCVDAATGGIRWRGRVGGTFSASPIAVGGTVRNVSADGEMVTLAQGDAFEVLGRASLGEECRATPAVVGRRMVLRTAGRLAALDAEPQP
ncbi:MAG: PQQ-binding-like beta-propeller repeat protein [Planctomycetaceae bacterium]